MVEKDPLPVVPSVINVICISFLKMHSRILRRLPRGNRVMARAMTRLAKAIDSFPVHRSYKCLNNSCNEKLQFHLSPQHQSPRNSAH